MYMDVDVEALYEHKDHTLTVREAADSQSIELRCLDCLDVIASADKLEYKVEVRATFIGYITAHGFSADDALEDLELPYNPEEYDEFSLDGVEAYDAFEA